MLTERRGRRFRPALESFEDRLVPSSVPLHAVGTHLQDSSGRNVTLRGVNLAGLESAPPGGSNPDANAILQSADEALNVWHANLLRVMVYPDFWFGHDEGVGLGVAADGGAAYRNTVSQIVAKANAANAYVMLTVWGSDRGQMGAAPALHVMPDANTTRFWSDANVGAARLFANNPAVMFDPFNEPEFVDWNTWKNGGFIDDGPGYNSPGMQGLLTAIRGTGANNLVSPEGRQYAHDLSGIASNGGFGLNDPAGNLMYQLHLYPNEWQNAADGDRAFLPVSGQYPVYIGEFGTLGDSSDPDIVGVAQPNPSTWTQNMIAWANQRGYSWTAWSFTADATPCLLSDRNYTPTSYFGSYVKSALAQQATPPVARPANDNFASRATITGSSATVLGTNVNATREAAEPKIVGNGGGRSVWYTWTAPAAGSVTITTVGSTFDTTLGVYTGTTVSSLTQVAANDDFNGAQTSSVTFTAVAGRAYQIAVDGWDGASGNINLNLAFTPARPANDNFASRATITGSTATVTGTNVNATREAGEPKIVGNGGGHSTWWTWTAPAAGMVTINTVGSNFDTMLGVSTGTTVSSLTQVAANDDFNGAQTSSVTFNAVAGRAYQIAVDGWDGASGNITLNLVFTPARPANDSFASRATITGSSATVLGTNVNATREAGEPLIVGNGGGRSVWYTWIAPTSGSVTINTLGSNFDTMLGVYTGSTISSLTQVAANDDFNGAQTSSVTFNAVAGRAYQIAVDGWDGASGNITLNLRYV